MSDDISRRDALNVVGAAGLGALLPASIAASLMEAGEMMRAAASAARRLG